MENTVDDSAKAYQLAHCIWMCDRGKEFITEGRTEKAMRWIGYIQGMLRAFGVK